MVNENHFRFDGKTFFNFGKMIYGFKNRKSFSEIELFVLARTFEIRLPESCIGRSSESRGHRNLAMVRSRPDLAKMAGSDRIWMEPAGFGWNRPLIRPRVRPILAKMVGIRPVLTGFGGIWQFWPNSAKHARRNLATTTGRCQILKTVTFSHFIIFSCEPNA
jgi:hypothetical protein